MICEPSEMCNSFMSQAISVSYREVINGELRSGRLMKHEFDSGANTSKCA